MNAIRDATVLILGVLGALAAAGLSCGSQPGRPTLPPPEYEQPAPPTPSAAPSAAGASVPFADTDTAVRVARRQVEEDSNLPVRLGQ
jgi:hypothetical protein